MAIRLTDSPFKAKTDRGFGARLVNDLPAPDRGSKIYYDRSPVASRCGSRPATCAPSS